MANQKLLKLYFCLGSYLLNLYTTGLQQYKYIYVNELVNEKVISIDCIDSYEFNGCGSWQTDYYGFQVKKQYKL